jgi:hypothetical protein
MDELGPRKKVHMKENLKEVQTPPNGFTSYLLQDEALLNVNLTFLSVLIC